MSKSARMTHYGQNNSEHYNFTIIDREIIFTSAKNGEIVPSSLGLSLEALGLYVILKSFAIDKNFVWPSLSTLEKLTGKSRKSVIKYINELIDKGLISKEKRKNNNANDSNIYIINQVQKENIKNKTLGGSVKNTPPAEGECKNSTRGSVKIPLRVVENLHPKYNNRIIINELYKDFPFLKNSNSELKDKLLQTLENITEEPQSFLSYQDKILNIKHPYIESLKGNIIRIFIDMEIYDKIDIVFNH